MFRSLSVKLALAFIAVAILTGLVLVTVFRSLNAFRLDQLVVNQQSQAVAENLGLYYQQTGSWAGLESLNPASGMGVMGMGKGMGRGPGAQPGVQTGGPGGFGGEMRHLFGLADENGKVLLPIGSYTKVGAQLSASELNKGTPILVDGKKVGTLLAVNRLPEYNPAEELYLRYSNRALLFAILGSLLIAGLIGWILSRSLTRPLRALTSAVQTMEAGQSAPQVPVGSKDEIGELASAFNSMSRNVERSNQLRRQMTADIAHDLRTPLTIIGGYIEAMQEGVLEATPERMELIDSEIQRLQTMVGDLRLLSQADAGELPLSLQPLEAAGLLRQSGSLFQQQAEQKGITLTVDAQSGGAQILGDEARLLQVLDNLLTNALRHTPAGGHIRLASRVDSARMVNLSVTDDGEGIPAEALSRIFERFQRVDPSRHSDGQESGLGLAIVKSLVEAHHGSISVQSTVGKGSEFLIRLPQLGTNSKN